MTPEQIVVFENAQLRRFRCNSPGGGGIGGTQPVVQLVGVGASPLTGPEKTTRPVASRVTSLHSAAKSSIRWLERTTAVPSRRQPGQHTVHVTGAGRIKAVRRFVEHQQPRLCQQRGGKPETLSHPE